MADDLQEIDGVGPSREEDLIDTGYETYRSLGEADAEQLAEEIDNLSGDKALEIVVQGQNLADLEEAAVDDGDSEGESEDVEVAENDSDEVDEEDEAQDSDDEEIDSEPTEVVEDEGEPDTVTLELGFDSPGQYDTFFYTVYETRNNYIKTNRSEQTGPFNNILDELREVGPSGTLVVELEPQDLHDLHNAIRGQVVDYRGHSLTEQHDMLQEVLANVDEIRQEELF